MRVPSILTSAAFTAGILFGVAGTVGAASMRGSDLFRDIPSGAYYDIAVGELNSAGIIKGNPDGTFNPQGLVTRADLAVMFQRLRDDLTGKVLTSSSRSSSSRSSSSSTTTTQSSSSSSASYNPKGAVRFTTNEIRVPENISTKKVTIAVVRTGGADGTVTVEYTTGGGTATEGTDYTKASGTLTFQNKETSKTFDIVVKDDSSSEGNETVAVTLSAPGGGVSIGVPASLTVIITDDESGSSSSTANSSSSVSSAGPTIGFSATQYSINEDMGTLTVTVVRGGSSSSTAAVNYATSNGTAKAGSEFTATSGQLSFGAGETSKTLTIPIADDNSGDGAKTFTITLSNATNVTFTPNLNVATVSINDNETVSFGSGSFKFSKSTYSVTESSDKVAIIVQCTGGSTLSASVNYATTAITASSGSDFTHTSGTLTFAPGEAAKVITVPIIKDTVADTGERFSVDLSNPTGNIPLITPYNAAVTIE